MHVVCLHVSETDSEQDRANEWWGRMWKEAVVVSPEK